MLKLIIIGGAVFVALLIVVCLIAHSRSVVGTYRDYLTHFEDGSTMTATVKERAGDYYVFRKDKTCVWRYAPENLTSNLYWKKKRNKIYILYYSNKIVTEFIKKGNKLMEYADDGCIYVYKKSKR